jgi:hypothetical protein
MGYRTLPTTPYPGVHHCLTFITRTRREKNLVFNSRSKQLGLHLASALLRDLYSISIKEIGRKRESSAVQDVSTDPIKTITKGYLMASSHGDNLINIQHSRKLSYSKPVIDPDEVYTQNLTSTPLRANLECIWYTVVIKHTILKVQRGAHSNKLCF